MSAKFPISPDRNAIFRYICHIQASIVRHILTPILRENFMTMHPTNRRILIVEDEMMIALMLESMLTDLGCEIPVRAVTTTEALAIIETDARIFDAATVDLNLHGRNSADVIAALELRGIPFIVTTGYADPASLGGFTGPIL